MLKSILVYSVLSASALALGINPNAVSENEPRGQNIEDRDVVMKDILRRNQDGSRMQLRSSRLFGNANRVVAALASPSPSPGPYDPNDDPDNNNTNNDDPPDDPDNDGDGNGDSSSNGDDESISGGGGDDSNNEGDDADGAGAMNSVTLGTLVVPAAALFAVAML